MDKGIITVPAIDQTRCTVGGLKATRKRFYWLIPIDRSNHALFRKSPCTREGLGRDHAPRTAVQDVSIRQQLTVAGQRQYNRKERSTMVIIKE